MPGWRFMGVWLSWLYWAGYFSFAVHFEEPVHLSTASGGWVYFLFSFKTGCSLLSSFPLLDYQLLEYCNDRHGSFVLLFGELSGTCWFWCCPIGIDTNELSWILDNQMIFQCLLIRPVIPGLILAVIHVNNMWLFTWLSHLQISQSRIGSPGGGNQSCWGLEI